MTEFYIDIDRTLTHRKKIAVEADSLLEAMWLAMAKAPTEEFPAEGMVNHTWSPDQYSPSLGDYQREAATTALYPGRNSPVGLMYAALGMCGEAAEVMSAVSTLSPTHGPCKLEWFGMASQAACHPHILDEMGDVLWYMAAVADESGLRLDEIPVLLGYHDRHNLLGQVTNLSVSAGAVAEMVKKMHRRNQGPTDLDLNTLRVLLGRSLVALTYLGGSLGHIAQRNLAKLRQRVIDGTLVTRP